ncbi:MAG: response regulator transcription factor [Gammaproteobacteria bacterium]|nr:response regulator transcription factor [Gammaproteobacteria bacterium]
MTMNMRTRVPEPTTSHELTVFVVDPDPSIHAALEPLIRRAGWRPALFESAEEFLAQPRLAHASCLVCDVCLPGLSGLELQSRLADRPEMPLIFLTGYFDIPATVRAMRAGAAEFLTKPCGDEVLTGAIGCALERSRTAIRQGTELRALRERHASLSRREREVMTLVVSGLLNKQVGWRLGISEITVKAHRGRVMRKMAVGSLAELVGAAARLEAAAPPHSSLDRRSDRPAHAARAWRATEVLLRA